MKNAKTHEYCRNAPGRLDGMHRLASTTDFDPNAIRDALIGYVAKHLSDPEGLPNHLWDRVCEKALPRPGRPGSTLGRQTGSITIRSGCC